MRRSVESPVLPVALPAPEGAGVAGVLGPALPPAALALASTPAEAEADGETSDASFSVV
jgi:hypothetical protein